MKIFRSNLDMIKIFDLHDQLRKTTRCRFEVGRGKEKEFEKFQLKNVI